jgi:putative ABC transport system permease protein
VAIGEGISQQAQKQIEGLGADNIIVRSIKPLNPSDQDSNSFILPYGLLREDYDRLVETIPTIKSALPIREMRRQVRFADRTVEARLVGCTPEYAAVTRLDVSRGRFIEPTDLKSQQNLCVLAAKVADVLFPYEDPLGRRIFLIDHEDYYTVVGVLEPRAATAAIGGSLEAQDFSNDVYIPITTLRSRVGDTIVQRRGGSREGETIELNQITLRISDVKYVERTAELVEETLKPYHGKVQDVAVVVPLELLRQAETTRIMFMVFMGLIAAISLLVGGIGIMNIMLATVTERTREIGIRRALGACRIDILWQFLVETVVLSVVGGLTGIAVGYACPLAIDLLRYFIREFLPSHIMASLPEVVQNVQPVILIWSVVGAFFISVFIGVLFGIYPAYRAAQMDPIEALRHE